jgi:hypothetical protein
MSRLAIAVGLTTIAACSSSAPPPQNVSTSGRYGFDGEGWKQTSDTSDDHWSGTKGQLIVRFITTPKKPTPIAYAQAEFDVVVTGTATSLLSPEAFPRTVTTETAAWYGWTAPMFGNVYEFYFNRTGASPVWITAEIAGSSLSQADARAVFASLRLLDAK